MTFLVAIPPPETAELTVASSTFWPTVAPSEIREAQRIDDTIPPPRLRTAIIEAIATLNAALYDWRIRQQLAGKTSLQAVDAEEVDGTSINIHRYRRAVGCLTKALLLERYRDFDSTAQGNKKADALTDPIDDCRRDYHNALSDILGQCRVTIELI